MVIGAGMASALRILLTGVVSVLLTLPYLRIVGACALLWIAVKLLAPARRDEEGSAEAAEDLWRAVRIVVVADIIMSFDNVIAIAAVAKGQYVLLALGLIISIPIVIAGSAIILTLLERFPALVWGGAAVLGWVSGDIFASDPIVFGFLPNLVMDEFAVGAQVLGALLVVFSGAIWRYRSRPTENEF